MRPSRLHVSVLRSVCLFVCMCVGFFVFCFFFMLCVCLFFLLDILRLFPSLCCVDPEQVGHILGELGTWLCDRSFVCFVFPQEFAAGL